MKSSLDKILNVVSEYTLITPENIMSKSRLQERVYARQLCFFFMRKYSGQTLKSIGEFMARGRHTHFDHTTVIHNIQSLNNRISTNEEPAKSDMKYLDKILEGAVEAEVQETTISECVKRVAEIMERIPEYQIPTCKTFGELAEYLNNKIKLAS